MKISHIQAKVNQYSSDGKRIMSESDVLTHFLHVKTPDKLVVLNILDVSSFQVNQDGTCGFRMQSGDWWYVVDPKMIEELTKFFQIEEL
jgi:hypothetical protein